MYFKCFPKLTSGLKIGHEGSVLWLRTKDLHILSTSCSDDIYRGWINPCSEARLISYQKLTFCCIYNGYFTCNVIKVIFMYTFGVFFFYTIKLIVYYDCLLIYTWCIERCRFCVIPQIFTIQNFLDSVKIWIVRVL